MTRLHVVLTQKGGMGKTTIAMNTAAVVGESLGSDPADPVVCVVSIDPQGSAVWWAEQGDPDLLPFDYDQMDDRPEGIIDLLNENRYTDVFVDAPGSLARPAALAKVLDAAAEKDGSGRHRGDVIVPIIPGEELAYDPTIRTVRELLEPRGLPYRVVRNRWDRRSDPDGKIDLQQLTDWLKEQEFLYANTVIRQFKLHRTAAKKGLVVTQYPAGRTRAEAKSDFLKLALEQGYGRASEVA